MTNIQEISRLYGEGYNQREIGVILGFHQTRVSQLLKKHGLTKKPKTPLERLESRLKLNEESGCIEFHGARNSEGYGQIRLNYIIHYTHRLAYEWYIGEIPKGMWVLHKCDNPPCCNTQHLFLGNRSDNMLDCSNKGRLKNQYLK